MTPRRLVPLARPLALVLAAFALAPVSVAGQTAKAQPWTMPRTPDGHPDFQGIWDFRTATPVERPRELAGKEFFASDEEAVEFERRAAERIFAGRSFVLTGTLSIARKRQVPD